jgi:hypothetical protein
MLLSFSFAMVLAVSAPAAQVADQRIGERITVVRESPFEREERDAARAKSPAELAAHYGKLGYHRIDEAHRTLLFSPGLWQEDAHAAHIALCHSLERGLDDRGLIAGGSSPALAAFVQATFGAMLGYNESTAALFAIEPSLSLTMSDGQKTITMGITPRVPPGRTNALLEMPLGTKTPVENRQIGTSPWPRLHLLNELHLMSFGKSSLLPSQRMADAADATRILADRVRATSVASAALSSHLLARGFGRDVSADMIDVGDLATRLPEPYNRQVEASLKASYKIYGFASPEDARVWFSNARVDRTRLQWMLEAMDRTTAYRYGLPDG